MRWLGVPVVSANACKAERYRLPGDVHVIGAPVEEQGRYDAFTAANNGVPILCVLADRGLTRDDCIEFVTRAGIEIPCVKVEDVFRAYVGAGAQA
jgi:hypothetical protein